MGIPVATRRAALIDAAIRVLTREGLAGASTRAIVTEANMSLASLHYAFDSRDALLTAVVERVVEFERSAVLQALPGSGSDTGRDTSSSSGADPVGESTARTGPAALEALLRSGVTRYLDVLATSAGLEHAMLEITLQSVRGPAMQRLGDVQYSRYREVVGELLREAADATRMRWRVPVEELATLVVALADGLTIAYLIDGEAPRLACDGIVGAVMGHAEAVDE